MDIAKALDANGTGTIDEEVLCNILMHLDGNVFTKSNVERLLSNVSRDHNRQVVIKQFVELLDLQPMAIADPNGASLPAEIDAQVAEKDVDRAPSPEGDDAQGSDDGFGSDDSENAKIKQQKNKPRRVSFTSQSITEEQVSTYTKPVHVKDEASAARIRQIIDSNDKLQVLMGHLAEEALADILNAFYLRSFEMGVDIIKQGENGDCLYIIDSGAVDIFVARPNADGTFNQGDRGTKVATWEAGALFGELALMYNAPRAATVTSAMKVHAWVLDAVDFRVLVMKAGMAKYRKYEGWLENVKLLKVLNHFELAQLADTVESELFDDGEEIIRQGDAGDKFFMVEDGTASAFIDGDQGELEVKQYFNIGDYFGELALLSDAPRRATVRATGQGCVVASVSKEDFDTLLGPIQERLQNSASDYPEYAAFLK